MTKLKNKPKSWVAMEHALAQQMGWKHVKADITTLKPIVCWMFYRNKTVLKSIPYQGHGSKKWDHQFYDWAPTEFMNDAIDVVWRLSAQGWRCQMTTIRDEARCEFIRRNCGPNGGVKSYDIFLTDTKKNNMPLAICKAAAQVYEFLAKEAK